MKIDQKLLTISFVLTIFISSFLFFIFSSMWSSQENAYAQEKQSLNDHNQKQDTQVYGSPNIRAILDNLVTPSDTINKRAVQTLQALGPDVIPSVINQFDGRETTRQKALLSILKAFHTPEVTSHLIQVLENSPQTKMAILIGNAIDTQGKEPFCSKLSEMSKDQDPVIRLGASIGLKTCRGGSCAKDLLRLIEMDTFSDIRKEALISIKSLPSAFLEKAIFITLQDKSPMVRYEAVKIIQEKDLVKFNENLKTLLREDPSGRIRNLCAQTIVMFKKQSAGQE